MKKSTLGIYGWSLIIGVILAGLTPIILVSQGCLR